MYGIRRFFVYIPSARDVYPVWSPRDVYFKPSLVPRPHPSTREKGLVNLNKILGPRVDLTTEFCSRNDIAARVIKNIPTHNSLQFLTRTT